MTTIHASCVAIGGRGVLIAGPSGSGKSDLVLRLIDRGALLVSDDYTDLSFTAGRAIATAPATIAGRIEIRGIGIVAVATAPSAPIALLVQAGVPERMPQPATSDIAGVAMPTIHLALLEPSAPLKVELMLRSLAS